MKNLRELTSELLETNGEILKLYKETRERGEKGDFYQEVKPFADEAKEKIDLWQETALEWMKKQRPKNLHPSQIINTAENLEMISIQAFFPEASYKRFISHSQSVHYVLQTVLEQLKAQQE
ncbi:YppE family protein [Bacillus sp. P14.5]|uniref:YppE family protein n=1 Tax=Bacillus sp. P14.5 TaxID=1983400 RepID=UPI000DE8D947|nr:YppE family protein [Bacillus sp. P14.5]